MANGKINLGKQSGGVLSLTFPDGATNTEVLLPESGTVATTSNIVGFKNYIINGNFDIWQRGTIFTVAPGAFVYTSDRWIVLNRSNQPVTVEIADNKAFSNLGVSPRMRIAYAIAPTTGDVIISQRIEDIKRLSSKTVTGSFYHSTLENFNISTYSYQNYGTGGSSETNIVNGSQTTAGDLSFKRYSATFNIPDFKDKTIGNNSWVDFTIVAPIRTTNPLSIAQVQLEEGSVATPFENRPYGLELSLCQRYYEVGRCIQQLGIGTTIGVILTGQVFFKTSKRVVPTVTYSDFSGAQNKVTLLNNSGTETNGVSTAAGNQTNNDMRLTASTTNTTQNGISFTYTASAEL